LQLSNHYARAIVIGALACGLQVVHAKSSPADPAASQGYVYVDFPKQIGDSTYIYPNNPRYVPRELMIRKVDDRKEYTLHDRKDPDSNGYGAWVPPGEYVISHWDNHKWGEYPSLRVETGRVTNLGRFIPISIGNFQFVMLPLRLTEGSDPVQNVLNELKGKLQDPAVIDWAPDVPPKPMSLSESTASPLGIIADLLEQYTLHVNKPPLNKQLLDARSIPEFLALAKSGVPPLNDRPAVDDRSNLYFGAALGQIRVRSPERAWSTLDTGTVEQILSVAWINNTLLAGSRAGLITASSDRGAHWVKLRSVAATEAVVSLNRVRSRWVIVTIHPTGKWNDPPSADSLTVYTGEKDDLSDLAVAQHLTFSDNDTLARWRADSYVSGQFLYVAACPKVLRLNLDTMEWKTITPSGTVHGLSVSSNGTLTTYSAMGMFSKVFVSSDHGDTWRKPAAPPYEIKDVYFDDSNSGRAVRWHSGAFSGTLEELTYDKSGDRWSKTAEAPAGCVKWLHDAAHRTGLCITRGNSILSQDGSTWRAEFGAE
jgi:hypothetical protein